MKKGLSKQQKEKLLEKYKKLLENGKSSQDIVANFSDKYGISDRQIYRYIAELQHKSEWGWVKLDQDEKTEPFMRYITYDTRTLKGIFHETRDGEVFEVPIEFDGKGLWRVVNSNE